ncbi:MAG: enoyl-CoA hydratase-related protein [Actinomycetota bacterium]|nr:enoyl-CoA hydratase-related protein [Actinomycetota bacterium]
MTEFECFEIAVEDSIGHLRLNRGDKRNAMNPTFFEELPRAVTELAQNDEVRAIVLYSNTKDFTVGLDLKESILHFEKGSVAKSARTMYQRVLQLQQSFSILSEIDQPTVAIPTGYCIGGGIDLISACDVRYTSNESIFSIREAKIAIVADLGTLQRLPAIISRGDLAELALTGDDFSAEYAKEIRLVSRVFPDREEAIAAGIALAKRIADNSPLATAGTKDILRSVYDKDLKSNLDRIALWNSAFIRSNDLGEAINAFVERRPPKFTGE